MSEHDDTKIAKFPGKPVRHVPVDRATVPCAKCGELIDGDARQCRHCGIHFDGRAFQFAPGDERRSPRRFLPWLALFIVLVILVLLRATLTPFGSLP